MQKIDQSLLGDGIGSGGVVSVSEPFYRIFLMNFHD